jgi:arsenate reductase-like glutaredoxin family protein
MSCKKAHGFLGQAGIEAAETVNARTMRYEGENALELLNGIDTLVAVKGKSFRVFDLRNDRPADEVLLASMLGPSGNLRAPTIRVGKTLVVGFTSEAFRTVLGV